jgi:hypothetical protein
MSEPLPEQIHPGDAAYLAILRGDALPDSVHWQAGWDAHAAGKPFHKGPVPFFTTEALCWRLGWNDRALANQS